MSPLFARRRFTRTPSFLTICCMVPMLTTAAFAQNPLNPIVSENAKAGRPPAEWDVAGIGDPSIQGFATEISVNRGSTVFFKIATTARAYRLDIYRLGYYGGMGARLVTTVTPTVSLPQTQPPCSTEAATKLIDCGTWSPSASWAVPDDATSGIYFAKVTRPDTGGASHIFFIVRDDASESAILFQTSDTTWQAYNYFGGHSLYGGDGNYDLANRAYKVSYNRPFYTRGGFDNGANWVFNAEYPMVRWLEANGYDVTYSTGVDTARRGSLLRNHRVFLSVGHDEYWSGEQRANVELARAAGVHLGFFSGNEIFRKTRWEASIDGTTTPYRTLVCYKETDANEPIDPADPPTWTGTWRDPRFSPPADGGRPENALSGTIFMVNGGGRPEAIQVPAADGKMRFWRATSVSTLAPGEVARLPLGTLGYEWDEDLDNGFRPAGLLRLSTTTLNEVGRYLLDYGSTYGDGVATHHLTLYRHPSGALVFGAGTIQWAWGLDEHHDWPFYEGAPADLRMQQATVNLLADMGVQAGTLEPGLTQTAASADTLPPTSTITAPIAGSTLPALTPVVVTGTATDTGGVVGAVEVSVDGGVTWHPAAGRDTWSYNWTTPGAPGLATIAVRAVDDSGNIESAGAVLSIVVAPRTCPCSVWGDAVPGTVDVSDNNAVELGVRFRSDVSGVITGIRFYKSVANTGTHVAHLWSNNGELLATATFTGETASGWQEVGFSPPAAIAADTTYVASYHTDVGHYSADNGYFQQTGVDAAPLHLLADGADGANGVYRYGASSFPTATYQSTNYWVDVVFASTWVDTAPPVVVSTSPADGSTGVGIGTVVRITFSEAMDASTVDASTVLLHDGNAPVPAAVSYDPATRSATLRPAASLDITTTYTASVLGGATGPAVKDSQGNVLAATYTWSFTTGGPPPNEGPGGPILVIASDANPFSRYYADILRAEGLNEFLVTDVSNLTATLLNAHDVAILAAIPLMAAQVTTLSDWVNAGGHLIAMRPDKQLAGLLGLTDASATLGDAYLRIDTARSPGAGLVNETIQFHGIADRYALSGATAIATLYSTATAATSAPAVTLHSVGSGTAAAFSYDLARSVIYTRQGNPAWTGQERDGYQPIRPDDLFYPNWVDLNKVAIPQADEQQRLLANLILHVNLTRKPLPRFWYLPRGLKAVVVMTGDDHGGGGTAGRFEAEKAASTPGCSVDDWECVRSTSYVVPGSSLTNADAFAYTGEGFEVGLHVDTGCADWTANSLDAFYATQLSAWTGQFASLPSPATSRIHCIVWSDYDTQPAVELSHGIRLDTNYYFWPPEWIQNRPGLFTGSGLPMPFTNRFGKRIDVYQAPTQMTDESGQTYPGTIDTLLDNALGADAYYGTFVANMHTDGDTSQSWAAIVASAQSRQVPIVSAKQLLTWLDGRNRSSFESIGWNANVLEFSVAVGAGAAGLNVMIPLAGPTGTLAGVTRNGVQAAYTTHTIKGVDYAFVDGSNGSYEVTYGAGTNRPPSLTNPGDQTSAEGDTVALQVTASDQDAGDTLAYSATSLPAGLSINSTSGLISGTVAYTAAPSYNVTVTVSDGVLTASATFVWTITDANRTPTVTNPGNQTSAPGASVLLQVAASDPDGDTLTYTATGLPPALGINSSTGRISGTVDAGAVGVHAVSVSVADGHGGSAGVGFTWTVTGPAATLSPTSLTFGSQKVGTIGNPSTITLTNTGTAMLTVTSVTIVGANAGDFAQTNNCGNSVAAGTSCSISVRFAPTAGGSRTATLTVTDDAPGTPHQASLSGTGTVGGVLLSPPSIDFGSQPVGTTSSARTITLTNNGTAKLSISSIVITGLHAGDFTRTTTCKSNLAVGKSCTVSVTFRPATGGARTASLAISDNAADSPQEVPLTGTGTNTSVALTPTSLVFGTVEVGASSAPIDVTLSNTGNAVVTVSTVVIAGTKRPTATGTRTATLVVDDGAGGHTAALSGSGRKK